MDRILYFPQAGPANTGAVIDCVGARLAAGDIGHVVVASTTGSSARRLQAALAGTPVRLIVVGEHAGFSGGDAQRLEPTVRAALEADGAAVFVGSHALSGVGRSVSSRFGGLGPAEIIAHTLRRFGGDGLKVAVEVAIMAADAGLVPTDRDVLAVGGTGGGWDTAIVLRAAHQNSFFDLEIREVLAKPRQRGTA